MLTDLRAEQLQQLPEKDGFDYDAQISILERQYAAALKDWERFANMVHKFDKTVDPVKRDASESITRDEGIRCFIHFAITMRTAIERYKEIVPNIREARNDEDAYMLVTDKFGDCLENALRGAVANNLLPQWAADAIESTL